MAAVAVEDRLPDRRGRRRGRRPPCGCRRPAAAGCRSIRTAGACRRRTRGSSRRRRSDRCRPGRPSTIRGRSCCSRDDVEHRMVDAGRRRRRIVDRREQRDVGAGALAGQLDGGDRRRDPPRVDQVVRRVEQLGAVEEERPLLGKEQRAARIERELAGVGLDLREVRVDRAVQRQVRRHAPADVAAELRPAGVVAASRRPPAAPSACAVTTGLRSSTRPRCRSVRPSSVPDCARNELFARSAGVQLSSWPLLCTRRMTLSAHDWTRSVGKRSVLNGIAISIS